MSASQGKRRGAVQLPVDMDDFVVRELLRMTEETRHEVLGKVLNDVSRDYPQEAVAFLAVKHYGVGVTEFATIRGLQKGSASKQVTRFRDRLKLALAVEVAERRRTTTAA